jgi:hypothetical protein
MIRPRATIYSHGQDEQHYWYTTLKISERTYKALASIEHNEKRQCRYITRYNRCYYASYVCSCAGHYRRAFTRDLVLAWPTEQICPAI